MDLTKRDNVLETGVPCAKLVFSSRFQFKPWLPCGFFPVFDWGKEEKETETEMERQKEREREGEIEQA